MRSGPILRSPNEAVIGLFPHHEEPRRTARGDGGLLQRFEASRTPLADASTNGNGSVLANSIRRGGTAAAQRPPFQPTHYQCGPDCRTMIGRGTRTSCPAASTAHGRSVSDESGLANSGRHDQRGCLSTAGGVCEHTLRRAGRMKWLNRACNLGLRNDHGANPFLLCNSGRERKCSELYSP
jgi:hypothetical protein